MAARHHELHSRTLAKTITWKLLAAGIAFGTTYYFTGSTDTAGKLAGTTFAIGLVAYYIHERIWNTVPWGRATLT